MRKSEMIERIQAIGQAGTVEEMRSLLATFQTDLEPQFDGFETATQQITTLEQANENLRQANMNLFLQVGKKPEKEEPTPEPAKKREFKDLFDDKGGLK